MPEGQAQQIDIEVLDGYFQQRFKQVPVLERRAGAEGITAITSFEDMIPLLFPHTTYKSYPESLIAKGQWAQMNKWLASLSTYPVDNVDIEGVEDVDDWINRLEAAGHLVSSSSGTSGKASFLNKTMQDRQASLDDLIDLLSVSGIPPAQVWNVVPVGPDTGISHHDAVRDLILSSYAKPDSIPLYKSATPVGGQHGYMSRLAAMRRAMAEGTAKPDEITAFEAEQAQRQANNERRLHHLAEEILKRPSEPIFFHAMVAQLYRLCEILREMGATEGALTGENALLTGGGLKGVTLPPDYLAQFFRLLNITPDRFMHYYSMQELNIRMPKCIDGRYHVPSKLVLFVLDKEGEELAEPNRSVVEGRAAFFDTTVDGRWGGTISGDKILADFGTCSCGRPGPSIDNEITRYSDLPDGDKITCAGTVDAYVRGFIES